MTPHHHITEFGNNLIYFSSQDIFLTAKWPNVLFTSHNSFKNTCGKCVEQLPNMKKKSFKNSRILSWDGQVARQSCRRWTCDPVQMHVLFFLVGWGVGGGVLCVGVGGWQMLCHQTYDFVVSLSFIHRNMQMVPFFSRTNQLVLKLCPLLFILVHISNVASLIMWVYGQMQSHCVG